MWPGVIHVSKPEFSTFDTGVVYAHKDAISRYISTLNSNTEAAEENEEQSQNRDDPTSLNDYIPIASGQMFMTKVPEVKKGKAMQVQHRLFDSLWNIGNRKIDASILLQPEITSFVDPSLDTEDNNN